MALPNDTYIVQFGPKVLAAMGPANRQSVLRWIRETQGEAKTELSPYLQKAAGYSDNAGTEIIMAFDLDGALSWERVAKYLNAHKEADRAVEGGTREAGRMCSAGCRASDWESASAIGLPAI